MDFEVVGEKGDFLAVNKPAGMLVHPTRPGGPRTLWDGLCELLGYERETGGQVSLINRLDRETSGLVLVAKSGAAARAAGIAMQQCEIHKEYLAVVFGWPEWEELTVDAPILRRGEVEASEVWLERMVHAEGAAARTRLRVEERFGTGERRMALVRAWPVTGRTHQIRVHLAHVGYPVVGDKLYARGSGHYLRFIEMGWTEEHERELWLPRHALHSTRVVAEIEGEGFDWVSEMPGDFRGLMGR